MGRLYCAGASPGRARHRSGSGICRHIWSREDEHRCASWDSGFASSSLACCRPVERQPTLRVPSILGWCSSGSRPSPRSSRRRGSPSTTAAGSSSSRATPTSRPRITRVRRPIGSASSRIAITTAGRSCVGIFFEGTKWTMNLAVARDGTVFVATRAAIYRLEDRDDDGRADGTDGGKVPAPIVRLDTPGDYPHNGLSGFAFDAQGLRLFRPGREPRRRLPPDRPRRDHASRAAARGAISTDAGPTGRSSNGSPPGSGTRST